MQGLTARKYKTWKFPSPILHLVIFYFISTSHKLHVRDDFRCRTFEIGKRRVCYHHLSGTGAQRTSRFAEVGYTIFFNFSVLIDILILCKSRK